jgi:geranylgeranyl pyrophosphate synthase
MLARIGAVLGGGSEQQVAALGEFFEGVGLAFQVMADVLNLRGFKGGLKERGEDVRQGKVTLPIVKAFGILPGRERDWLWHALTSKSNDSALVETVIETLEQAGALPACEVFARTLVEDAWTRLDPLLPESQFKVMFRAFGWYVLDRHY